MNRNNSVNSLKSIAGFKKLQMSVHRSRACLRAQNDCLMFLFSLLRKRMLS